MVPSVEGPAERSLGGIFVRLTDRDWHCDETQAAVSHSQHRAFFWQPELPRGRRGPEGKSLRQSVVSLTHHLAWHAIMLPLSTQFKAGAEKFRSFLHLRTKFVKDDETWEMMGRKSGLWQRKTYASWRSIKHYDASPHPSSTSLPILASRSVPCSGQVWKHICIVSIWQSGLTLLLWGCCRLCQKLKNINL